jgi:hypothetical protein
LSLQDSLGTGLPAPPAQGTQLDALRDRAIEESIAEGHPSATTLSPFRAPMQSRASGAPSRSNPTLMQELSHTVKETLRPSYMEAMNSGVVDAIRSVTSGADPDPSSGFGNLNAGGQNEAKRKNLATEGRAWDTPNGSTRPISEQEKATDNARAQVLLMALIDEIKPWALSAAGLYGLYHLVKLGLTYRQRKSGRHRRRRRSTATTASNTTSSSSSSSFSRSNRSGGASGRVHRHRSRSAPRRESVELERSAKNPAHSPAP